MKKLSAPAMSQTPLHFYGFGDFRFDPAKKVLWRDGDIVALTPRASDVLLLLLNNHGNLVERQEIIDRVWAETFVEDGNLNHAISALRKVLGNDIIQTVPRRGYRFTADVYESPIGEQHFLLEKRTSSTTIVEEQEIVGDDAANATSIARAYGLPDSRYITLLGAIGALVLAAGLWFAFAPRTDSSAPDKTRIKSLAVLPLKSFSRDRSDEELRLRITDALITRLGQIDDLAVRPTSSVLRFAGEEQDVSNAGRSLGVDAILDGRVQEENGLLRVTLQLIAVSSGDQLWSDQFDGKVGEILSLQDAISGRLLSTLQRSERDKSQSITQDSRAYEAYLKGRYFWNQRTPDNYSKAINHFQEAIRLDAAFALAYSGLADSYVLVNRRLDDDPAAMMLRAEEAAGRGLELNDRLAETHTSMALVLSAFRRDWKRSNEHFVRAIELNPQYAIARAWYGLNLISIGRFEEAGQQLEEARRLDPTSRNIAVYFIVRFYQSRDYDAAIEQGQSAIELDPQLSTAYMFMSYAYEQKGLFKEAVESELARQRSISPDEVNVLRAAFERSGIRGFWQKQIEIKNRQYSSGGVNCRYELATRHALFGDVNKALSVIEDNFRFGGTCWNGLANEPAFDGLWSHPRFQAVIREMGFPQ